VNATVGHLPFEGHRTVADLDAFAAVLKRIDCPHARKVVIMAKWERGELSDEQAERLIRNGGLAEA
jgi:hypothetical protein